MDIRSRTERRGPIWRCELGSYLHMEMVFKAMGMVRQFIVSLRERQEEGPKSSLRVTHYLKYGARNILTIPYVLT